MKLLVAEDDVVSRKMMCRMLSKYGECDVAENGQAAIDLFRESLDKKEPYRLVFLDIMMPDVDGKEALRAIRNMEEEFGITQDKRSSVFMLTALSDSRIVKEAFQLQCDGYIVKPVDRKKLEYQLSAIGAWAGA